MVNYWKQKTCTKVIDPILDLIVILIRDFCPKRPSLQMLIRTKQIVIMTKDMTVGWFRAGSMANKFYCTIMLGFQVPNTRKMYIPELLQEFQP